MVYIIENFPFIAQKLSKWCWAAAMEMVMKKDFPDIQQCELVTRYLNFTGNYVPLSCVDCNPISPHPDCNRTIKDEYELANYLKFYGYRNVEMTNTATFQTFYEQITKNLPVIIIVQSSDKNAYESHAVVCFGIVKNTLLCVDPKMYCHEKIGFTAGLKLINMDENAESEILNCLFNIQYQP